MKKVAVVILNWNGKKLLKEFLPSVVRHTTHNEVDVIVADNGSSDDSLLFLSNSYPQIKTIVLEQNYGFADGYNRALNQIESEYFVLLNSDVEVTQDWLLPIIDFLDRNKDVAAAQPKILSQRNKAYFEYAGASGGFIDRLGYPFCRGRIFKAVEEDKGQYDNPIDVLWATGACLVIRSNDFFEAGGFDATFFAHMEEIDLCWRLLARGKSIKCIPASEVYHYGGATLDQENPRKVYLNFRNNLLMLYKNMADKEYKKLMCIRWFLDYLASFFFLLTGSFSKMKAVWKARKDFQKIKPQFHFDRMENLTKTSHYNIIERKKFSILVKYYLMRKRKFSELTESSHTKK